MKRHRGIVRRGKGDNETATRKLKQVVRYDRAMLSCVCFTALGHTASSCVNDWW